jgi:RNA polymerase sigma factor (sigma-70 family)
MDKTWTNNYSELIGGKIDAFWELWRETETVLVRHAFRKLRSIGDGYQISDAEDVVHEVMLRARAAFEAETSTNLVAAFSTEEGARKYLSVMVENEIKNGLRKNRRQTELGETLGVSYDLDRELETERAVRATAAIGMASARAVLGEMSERDRQIFDVVRHLDGTQEQRYVKAAEQLGIPPPTVKKRWLRAQNEWKRLMANRLRRAEIV